MRRRREGVSAPCGLNVSMLRDVRIRVAGTKKSADAHLLAINVIEHVLDECCQCVSHGPGHKR